MSMIEGGFSITSSDNAGRIAVQTDTATVMFNNFVVKNIDADARALGLYADVNLGRNLKARFISFNTPKHLLSSRKNGCQWNPKTGVTLGIDEFDTCPVEANLEQCPDALFDSCFERIFDPNSTSPWGSTAESQDVLARIIEAIYTGMGNSFYSLYNFANHPLIDQANEAGTYAVDADEWAAYVDQQMSGNCGGLVTQLDALAQNTEYAQYYSNVIATGASGINETTNKFDGDVIEFFRSVIDAASPELKIAVRRGIKVGTRQLRPIMLVTYEIFRAYQKWIQDNGSLESAYRYLVTLNDGVTTNSANILAFENIPVLPWDAFIDFDATVGVNSHRALLTVPGNFGVIASVDGIQDRLFAGQGLVIQESPLLKDGGKYFMKSTFRWGAAIADPKLAVMFSRTL